MFEALNRRALLRRGAFTTAGAVLLPGSFAVAQDASSVPSGPGGVTPATLRLGIASYTFRKFDRAQLLAFMKQLRMSNLNLKDVHLPMSSPEQVKAAAAELRDAGMNLTAVGTITFNKDDDADVRAKFEYARAAGVPVIVAAPTKEVLPRIERFVREYDMRVAIHNHGPEDKVFPSPLDVLAAVQDLDERIGCCVDVGHCLRAGVDPVEAIRRAGTRVYDVHMKDLASRTEKESQVAVGEGIMPVRDVLQILINNNYTHCVDLEYEIHETDPMPGVIESVAYLRGALNGMSAGAVRATRKPA